MGRLRLRVKTKTNPRNAGRPHGSTKVKPSTRDAAVASGLIPKSRNPFVLFLQEEIKKPEYTGKPWSYSSKRIGTLWANMPCQTKNDWIQKAQAERDRQKAAMTQHGLMKGTVEPAGVVGVTAIIESSTRFGPYEVLRREKLGSGSYGRVVVCSEVGTGRRVVVKVFEDSHGIDARHEIDMYTRVAAHGGCRSILKILEGNPHPPTPWVALPFVPGTTLRVALRDALVSVDEKYGVVQQISQALSSLHQACIAHMDLKPDNILWNPYAHLIYVIDLGGSVQTDPHGKPVQPSSHAGVTAPYRPPELWAAPLRLGSKCRAVDAWSFGCVIAEVFSGTPLFWKVGESTSHIRQRVDRWCVSWHTKQLMVDLVHCPHSLRTLVWWLCAPQPGRRPEIVGDMQRLSRSLPQWPRLICSPSSAAAAAAAPAATAATTR